MENVITWQKLEYSGPCPHWGEADGPLWERRPLWSSPLFNDTYILYLKKTSLKHWMFKSRKVDLSMNHSMQKLVLQPLLSGRLDFDITIAESILNCCRRRLSGLVNMALRVVTVEDDAETVDITTGCPKKNVLLECCWSHSVLAQSQVAGTPCVWKLFFGRRSF